jgi:hypothetical protein
MFVCISHHTQFILYYIITYPVKWVPCHHGMARPKVADGGDGLHISRVAANILNKKSRTADKGSSPAWGLGVEVTTPHHKKQSCYENS